MRLYAAVEARLHWALRPETKGERTMTEATGGGGRPDVQRRLTKGGPEDDPSRRALLADGGELSDQDLEAVVGGLLDPEGNDISDPRPEIWR